MPDRYHDAGDELTWPVHDGTNVSLRSRRRYLKYLNVVIVHTVFGERFHKLLPRIIESAHY